MLAPARVAWIGGSGMAPAIGYMQANGFAGEAAAVNPRRADIAGLPCAADVESLPWAPDVAVLVIPQAEVVDTIRRLAALGCGGVVCISSGFSESIDGGQRQQALVEAAGDMPVLGPNCPGFGNFLDGAVLMMDHFGDHSAPAESGVAVISNGGAYLSDLGCAERSLPVAYLVGVGNQATVSAADMLDVVLDDERVKAANIYLEGIRDIETLSRAAAKAARLQKPVVAVSGGRSAAGARAAQSHTASLSADAAVAAALLRRFGWIAVRTTAEAVETLKMLVFTALPAGGRTGFITSSGSYAVLGADLAERDGLSLPPPRAQTVRQLQALLPSYVTPSNPLDITDAQYLPVEKQREVFSAFMREDYDTVLMMMCYPPAGGWDMALWDASTAALAQASAGRAAAFVNTLPEALPAAARERMAASGVAPLQGMEDGVRAIAHAARYGRRRAALNPEAMPLPAPPAPPPQSRRLDELAAKALLRQAGIQTPRHWMVEAGAPPPADIAYPVALKAQAALAHKTEAGAVQINIADSAALMAAAAQMQARLQESGVDSAGLFAEAMVAPVQAELLAGVRRVPGIGLALTLAAGGVMAELLQDAATIILPAADGEIEEALRGLRLFPLIGGGWRGRAPLDIAPALDAARRLAALAADSADIIELEVNPLILTGARAVAADATACMGAERKPSP